MSDPNTIEDAIENELDAAMAMLDQTSLHTTMLSELASPPTETASAGSFTRSPTLDALDASRGLSPPKASTVCERCPNSMWFASRAEVKCYCRVMFLITWSSKEQNQITHCDGEFLSQD